MRTSPNMGAESLDMLFIHIMSDLEESQRLCSDAEKLFVDPWNRQDVRTAMCQASLDLRLMKAKETRIKESFCRNDDIETIIDGIHKERMKSDAQKKLGEEKKTAVDQLSQEVEDLKVELALVKKTNSALNSKIASMNEASSQDGNFIEVLKEESFLTAIPPAEKKKTTKKKEIEIINSDFESDGDSSSD